MSTVSDPGDPVPFAVRFEVAFARLQVEVENAWSVPAVWPLQTAGAIRTLLNFAAARPPLASTLTVEPFFSEAEGMARHRRLMAWLAGLLAPGEQGPAPRDGLPDLTELALAAGILATVADRLEEGRAAQLPDLSSEAIEFVLAPYLGAERARRLAGGGR